MSASKRHSVSSKAVLTKFGEFGTFKKLKSGRVKTLRGRPKVSDVFDQNSNSSTGLGVAAAGQPKGSGRSSMMNIFPLSPEINRLNVNPFEYSSTSRPPLPVEPVTSCREKTQISQASITLSKHEMEEAVNATNKIFDFLWDSEVQPNNAEHGKLQNEQKRDSGENFVMSF